MSGTLKEIAVKRSDVFWIDPIELAVKPEWNSRNFSDADNKAHIASLKLSIRSVGVLEPLTVFREDDKNYISDGHCRHAAVLELLREGIEIKAVPVKTEGRKGNEADALLRQALDGKPKTAFELGHIFARLIGYGWTEEQIADRSGKGLQSVRMSLELQSAPIEVQKMVASGRVAPTEAVKAFKKNGSETVKVLGDAIDHAAQRGKQKATAQDIGQSPAEPRKARLTQVAELVEGLTLIETAEDWRDLCEQYGKRNGDTGDKVALLLTDSERTKLYRLLDI